MLIPHTRLLNSPILSLQTGAPLGQTVGAIIDPRQLTVAAFYCGGSRIAGKAVLHTDDIREISNVGLIVDDADVLMTPDEDLVRLKEVINFNFALIGKQVVDTMKRKLGKVDGFSVDIDSFYIIKLSIKQPLLRDFFGGTLLIDRAQIAEINDYAIVVHPNIGEERSAAGKRQLSPMIDNPFRQHKAPQPGSARIESD